MSEHYTAATLEVTEWCNVCRRQTRHRVDARELRPDHNSITGHTRVAGRLGPCLEHGPKVNARGENKKQETARQRRERAQIQGELFAPARGIRP